LVLSTTDHNTKRPVMTIMGNPNPESFQIEDMVF
jgi:hypothetical protein